MYKVTKSYYELRQLPVGFTEDLVGCVRTNIRKFGSKDTGRVEVGSQINQE